MVRGIIAQAENATADETPSITPDPGQVSASLAPFVQTAQPTHRLESPPAVLYEFSKALALNPDTIGRLKLGESIDTYVVQRDNAYYLRHSFSDEYSLSGAIFLDVTCSIYPKSRALIIHGHNMKDGTAFGKLRRFSSADYLNRYPVIRFSTLYETGTYLPFAVGYFSVDPLDADYLDIYQANSLSEQVFTAFTQKVRSMASYRIGRWACWDDSLLILMTCAGDDPDGRFAVFAVKQEL